MTYYSYQLFLFFQTIIDVQTKATLTCATRLSLSGACLVWRCKTVIAGRDPAILGLHFGEEVLLLAAAEDYDFAFKCHIFCDDFCLIVDWLAVNLNGVVLDEFAGFTL